MSPEAQNRGTNDLAIIQYFIGDWLTSGMSKIEKKNQWHSKYTIFILTVLFFIQLVHFATVKVIELGKDVALLSNNFVSEKFG